jgi:hypothetical protein
LHQHQRPRRTERLSDGSEATYLEATAADIAIADAIAGALLVRTLDDLPPQTRRLWDALRRQAAALAQAQGLTVDRVPFTRRDAQRLMAWSYDQVRVHLDRLERQEYVLSFANAPGQVARYRLAPGLIDDGPRSPVLHVDPEAATPTETPTPAPAPAPTSAPTYTSTSATLGGSGGGLVGTTTPDRNDEETQDGSDQTATLGGLGRRSTPVQDAAALSYAQSAAADGSAA